MKIRICITAFRRPRYLETVLRGLRQNPGIDGLEHFYFVDSAPSPQGVQQKNVEIIQKSGLPVSGIFTHPAKVGCTGNIGTALHFGFSDPSVDAVIMLEDDCLPGPDFLEYMTTTLRDYQDDRQVATVTGFSRRFKEAPKGGIRYSIGDGDPNACSRMKDVFCCWGWATWRQNYEILIARRWGSFVGHHLSWDICMKNALSGANAIQIKPDLSRIQNIGSEGGAYCPSVQYHALHQHTDYWTGDGRARDPRRFGFSFSEVVPEILSDTTDTKISHDSEETDRGGKG